MRFGGMRHAWLIGLGMVLAVVSGGSEGWAEPQGRTSKGHLDYVDALIGRLLKQPELVAFIQAQNRRSEKLSQDQILSLDKRWRAGDAAVINPVVGNKLSTFLKHEIAFQKGKVAELIVMDRRGLAVGVSPKTSDLWQGDEAKWQKTFALGPAAHHVGRVALDESTRKWQSQISRTISLNGAAIGAITVGIDVAFRAN